MSRGSSRRKECPAPRAGGKPPKQKFTREQAEEALLTAKIQRGLRGNARRQEQSAYPCDFCGWWHLTTWDITSEQVRRRWAS